MGIDASWITESGEPKQEVFDPSQHLTSLATNRWDKLSDTMCLRFIDPWGDATFNQAQIPRLLEELRSELREWNEPEVKSHLEKVVRLVERAVERTHTYIKFTGD
jgi:hypothetical protein